MQPPLLPHEKAIRAGFLLVCALALGVLFAKAANWPVPQIPCAFKNLTGLPCAMCGGTRAATALVSGDWKKALEWNALVIPVLAAFAFFAASVGVELLRGRALINWNPLSKRLGAFLPLTLLLLVGWWIVHVQSSLKKPDSDLVDLRNPVAAALADFLGFR